MNKYGNCDAYTRVDDEGVPEIIQAVSYMSPNDEFRCQLFTGDFIHIDDSRVSGPWFWPDYYTEIIRDLTPIAQKVFDDVD